MERAKPGPDRRPRGALETLEREEERALEDLERSLASAGDELCALRDVRELARRHPELSVAVSAALGVLLAPALAGVARTALPVLLQPALRGHLARVWLRSRG